jgi:hypothetical protein
MTSLALILILFTASNNISATQVGVIYNASLTTFPSNRTISASSCNECLCTMLNFTGNTSILSLNCYTNNTDTVICELFSPAAYASSYVYSMENNSNSTFYFQQLPSIVQSETTTEMMMATSEGMNHILSLFQGTLVGNVLLFSALLKIKLSIESLTKNEGEKSVLSLRS